MPLSTRLSSMYTMATMRLSQLFHSSLFWRTQKTLESCAPRHPGCRTPHHSETRRARIGRHSIIKSSTLHSRFRNISRCPTLRDHGAVSIYSMIPPTHSTTQHDNNNTQPYTIAEVSLAKEGGRERESLGSASTSQAVVYPHHTPHVVVIRVNSPSLSLPSHIL